MRHVTPREQLPKLEVSHIEAYGLFQQKTVCLVVILLNCNTKAILSGRIIPQRGGMNNKLALPEHFDAVVHIAAYHETISRL